MDFKSEPEIRAFYQNKRRDLGHEYSSKLADATTLAETQAVTEWYREVLANCFSQEADAISNFRALASNDGT
jgi:hypothetical protein